MYLYMCVCVYVCMYVCMYVCINIYTCILCMYVCMGIWLEMNVISPAKCLPPSPGRSHPREWVYRNTSTRLGLSQRLLE
jgi:hypothetical protein